MNFFKMISYLLTSLLLLGFGGAVVAGDTISKKATSSAPFIDYQWTVTSDACPIHAEAALEAAGFTLKPADTEDDSDDVEGSATFVGIKGDYKGMTTCIGEAGEVLFIVVAGPDYKTAKNLALKIKKSQKTAS